MIVIDYEDVRRWIMRRNKGGVKKGVKENEGVKIKFSGQGQKNKRR
jgi:hypothetical protein